MEIKFNPPREEFHKVIVSKLHIAEIKGAYEFLYFFLFIIPVYLKFLIKFILFSTIFSIIEI